MGGTAALLAAGFLPAGIVTADDESPEAVEDKFLGTAEDFGVSHPGGGEGETTTAPDQWFVQLKGNPTLQGGSSAAVRGAQQDFLDDARGLGASVEVDYSYGTIWNGLSVRASEADIKKAAASNQVAAVFPVAEVQAPEPQSSPSPDLQFALQMTGADVAQNELGLTGEGIKVAVMDTGVDFDHPDFGGSGTPGSTPFPTERVAFGYDFVGDDFNASSSSPAYSPDPVPDNNPDDCQGHGTHVAGIVGADGEVTGVAPEATLGAYRVFGCEGSTTSDIMLAAMERAHADGMDVLNMSIGSAFMNWPQYPTAVGSDALVDAGMVVVASIGNSGASGTWSAGAPGVGEHVIGVASFDNSHFTASSFTVGPDDTPIPYVVGSPAPEPPTEGTATLSRLGAPGSAAAAACSPIGQDLSGTVVLVQRGGHPPHQGCERPERGRRRRGALQQRARLREPVAGRSAADHHPVRLHLAGGRCADRRSHPERCDRAHVDRRDRDGAEPDRRPDLQLQLLRHGRGPEPEAGHRCSGRRHLLDVPVGDRWSRHAVRHLDVLAPRGGNGGAAAGGTPGHPGPRGTGPVAEPRHPGGVVA